MDEEQKSFLDRLTSPLTGDYRKKKPLSVKGADVAISMTPVGSAVDISEELGEEDPSIAKIGLIAAGDVLGTALPAAAPVVKTLIKGGVKKLDEVVEVKDLTKNAETNALEQVGLTEEALEAWKAKNYAKDKFRIPRHPKLVEAAEKLRDGKLNQEEYIKLSRQIQPIVTIKEMPKFPSKEDVIQALHATDKRKVEKGIVGVNKQIPDGTPISARLDIPAYNDTDTWIVSLHDGTTKNGNTVAYAQTAVLTDVNFTTNPLAATSIAAGKPKTTIGRMNGSYVNADPDDVYDYTKEILENEAEGWTQVGMNPTRASYFYDKSDGMPVVSADEVVQVGPLVMAKNVRKTTPDDVMFEFTNKRTGVTANFSEGGMAIEEQMMSNFGDVPDNTIGVDPVSGNEIPMGSTAENVRDDIPSMLSEGEIVMAADVVNFHGVKLFEELRAEAKMGYAQMQEDGRIGGEPIEEDMDTMGLEMSDLEVMEMPDDTPEVEEAFLGKFFAGLRESNRKQQEKNKQSVRDRFKAAEERRSVDKIKAGTNKKPKFKNKAEEMLYNMQNRSSGRDDRRVTLTEKPPTSDDTAGPSIAEQINFGGDYDKTEKKKAKPKKVKPGGRATPFVDDAREQEGVNLRSTEGFGTKFMRGLGVEGYDEGGQVFQQKGGFDMSEAAPVTGVGTGDITEGTTMEAVIYVNDAGHEITIMFANGVPITPIPPGYYPKSETVTPETGQAGGGNDDPPDTPAPTPINYKELSIAELTEMVKEQGDLKGDLISGALGLLNPFLGIAARGAMLLHRKNIERELKRRKADPTTTEVDGMRLDNLIEFTEREKPNFIDKITGKAFEKTVAAIPKPVTPDEDYSDPTMAPSVAEPYTPEAETPNVTKSAPQIIQDEIDIKRIEDEMKSQPRPYSGSTYDEVPEAAPVADPDPTYEVTTPEVRDDSRKERDAQRRRDRQRANRNMAGQSTARKTDTARSATRGLSTTEKKGGAGLDSRYGISGLKHGGLATKKGKKKK